MITRRRLFDEIIPRNPAARVTHDNIIRGENDSDKRNMLRIRGVRLQPTYRVPGRRIRLREFESPQVTPEGSVHLPPPVVTRPAAHSVAPNDPGVGSPPLIAPIPRNQIVITAPPPTVPRPIIFKAFCCNTSGEKSSIGISDISDMNMVGRLEGVYNVIHMLQNQIEALNYKNSRVVRIRDLISLSGRISASMLEFTSLVTHFHTSARQATDQPDLSGLKTFVFFGHNLPRGDLKFNDLSGEAAVVLHALKSQNLHNKKVDISEKSFVVEDVNKSYVTLSKRHRMHSMLLPLIINKCVYECEWNYRANADASIQQSVPLLYITPQNRSYFLQQIYHNPHTPKSQFALYHFIRNELGVRGVLRKHVVMHLKTVFQEQLVRNIMLNNGMLNMYDLMVRNRKFSENRTPFEVATTFEIDLIDFANSATRKWGIGNVSGSESRYILTVVNHLTGLASAVVVQEKSASVVYNAIMKVFYSLSINYGLILGVHILTIKCDEGSEFSIIESRLKGVLNIIRTHIHHHGSIEKHNSMLMKAVSKSFYTGYSRKQTSGGTYSKYFDLAVKESVTSLNLLPRRSLSSSLHSPTTVSNAHSLILSMQSREVREAIASGDLRTIEEKTLSEKNVSYFRSSAHSIVESRKRALKQNTRTGDYKRTVFLKKYSPYDYIRKNMDSEPQNKKHKLRRGNLVSGTVRIFDFARILSKAPGSKASTFASLRYKKDPPNLTRVFTRKGNYGSAGDMFYKSYMPHWSYEVYILIRIQMSEYHDRLHSADDTRFFFVEQTAFFNECYDVLLSEVAATDTAKPRTLALKKLVSGGLRTEETKFAQSTSIDRLRYVCSMNLHDNRVPLEVAMHNLTYYTDFKDITHELMLKTAMRKSASWSAHMQNPSYPGDQSTSIWRLRNEFQIIPGSTNQVSALKISESKEANALYTSRMFEKDELKFDIITGLSFPRISVISSPG